MTESELLERLDAAGYRMTERRITDWIKRGVLPKRLRGKGTGRTPRYYWERADDVVDQAIAAENLLAWYGRVSGVYIPLWLMGYEVSLDRVRPKLIGFFQNRLLIDAKEPGTSHEDFLSDQSERLRQFIADRPRRLRAGDYLPEAFEFLLNLFQNPDFNIEMWGGSLAWTVFPTGEEASDGDTDGFSF